ncbi:MAG: NrtA/SsuA/CpmA family ABC transporter substrate-binding protein [Candidatus Tectomicrobia bacterium]|uniref:NrtA/SsuA/CpmA family ABC transporter substrate-binding protein n=1 Tax=Tectimicrobiota bacterium TaxID=2528274 RepID=A0A932GPW5_UNCTE|nr:NrtA/SsuA/CpmA family ABC transporter substrate-binding protein [Candidatus Tectomicrobia bacterium]
MRIKLLAIVSLILTLAPALAAGPAFPQETKPLRYGTTISVLNMPIWVARESKLFTKFGQDMEVVLIQGGALITMGILSGELQFSGAGAESVVAARIKGGDIELLACPADSDVVYLITRPEIKTPAELKGKTSAVTRLGSSTHFYLRSALRYIGLNPDKDVTILQLGTEFGAGLASGRVASAALSFDQALPYLQKGYPVLLDLTKTDFIYPASCVVSSSAFVKANPDRVENFLKAYVSAINLIKKDHSAAERAMTKMLRVKDPEVARKTVDTYASLFKSVPLVPDKGLEAVLAELAERSPVPKEFMGRFDYFRDNGPLEKLVKEGWIDRLYK